MHSRSFLAACVALLGIAGGGIAAAAPCTGFTDVDDASAFCPNVEWLKNRTITVGCSQSTLYCPDGVVSRLTMAAFLNRLGVALTPIDLTSETEPPSPRFLAGNPVICTTPDFAVTDFPRRAYVNAV